MQGRTVLSTVATAWVILGLAGCGSSGASPDLVSVSGVIKLDGTPLKSGTINFTPTDGKKPTAGGTILDGSYSAQVPTGPMKISISAPKVIGKKKAYDTPDSAMIDIVEEAIPPAYNASSKLEHNVTAAKSDLNFDLKSTP